MSIAMTFNFLFFTAILQRNILGSIFYEINLTSLSDVNNNLITILILFVLPIVIVNYFLIFRKKRYEELIKKYPYYNGKLAATYISMSISFPIVLVFIVVFVIP